MAERSTWAGHHSLEFVVFPRMGNWYWHPKGHRDIEHGSFPDARAAFLDAVHSYYWPSGSIIDETNPSTDERSIKVWHDKGYSINPWRWAYFKGQVQDGGSCGAQTREEALRHAAASVASQEALAVAPIDKSDHDVIKIYPVPNTGKWYWIKIKNGTYEKLNGPYSAKGEALLDAALKNP